MADHEAMSLTTGPHPMALLREGLMPVVSGLAAGVALGTLLQSLRDAARHGEHVRRGDLALGVADHDVGAVVNLAGFQTSTFGPQSHETP